MAYSMFKAKFKKTIAEAIYQEVTSRTAVYYHWFGKENPWTDFLNQFIPSGNVDAPGPPSDNFRYDLHVRRDILTAKKIKPSDVSYVVRRIDWKPDTVYDMYDDAYDTSTGYGYAPAYSGATRLEDANFYVLTSEYNVYKCIWNALDQPSTVMPTGTGYEIFTTADGYRWKFMYTIPPGLRNKFLSADYMPVSNSIKAQYYRSGEILNIGIENGGSGYNPATTYATIEGDGYSEENPYIIEGITILSNGGAGGVGYTADPTLTISEPFPFAAEWTAGNQTSTGVIIKYTNPITLATNYYRVLTGTILGTSGPIHTTGVATNGTCQLKYVGTRARAVASITGDTITDITVYDFGYGYQGTATVVASDPVVKTLDWYSGGAVNLGDIVFHEGNYYDVTVAGTLGLNGPIHTTGIATNGSVSLNHVARDPNLRVDIVKSEASISLDISPLKDSIYTVNMTNTGSKYVEVPEVTFSAPPTGDTAVGTPYILDGKVLGVTLSNPGNGYITAPSVTFTASKLTFDGASNVDEAANTIDYAGHLFQTGDRVTYSNGGGSSIGGLVNGNTYFVIRVDANTLKLASSLSNANSSTAIDISDGSGAEHTLTLLSDVATGIAVLGTGGEIVGYTILDPGIGYSQATIKVVDTTNSGSGAVLNIDFDIGSVDTLQSTVELLAVPGSIEAIKVVDGGTGYGAATIEIRGDGTGAKGIARCTGGKLVGIDITDPGTGYTWTDIKITGNTGSSGTAAARAIMSPISGHGSDAIDELNANAIVFYTALARDKNQGIEIDNDYRKVGLIRNLKQFGSNRRFTEDTGSGCVLITGEFDKTKLQYDMLLLKDEYKKYRIVEFTDTQILLSVFNNFSLVPGDTLVTDPTNAGLITNPTVPQSSIFVTAVSERTIDQFSGDFLFFSVREPYSATEDQIITVRTVVAL